MKPKKEKKPMPEWKIGILDHHQRRPSRSDRADFPRQVVIDLIEETSGVCQTNCGRQADQTHHVMPRGRDGRGVKTNAMRLCGICHEKIQTEESELQRWIEEWERRFGPFFWYDSEDWENHKRKAAAAAARDTELKQFRNAVDTVSNLISVAANRALKKRETSMLHRLNTDDLRTLVGLLFDALKGEGQNELPNSNE
ncbi:hypothetical protein [Paenibacillus sp. P22]|uniref:hypothetical protein n=1 Tax=Paenibacillus sp. P22 TaxID=483908 RepID=UPI00038F4CD7|nr:hypothetical protein [Paenibacillus sp. P22]CDN44011.1 Uncharacterized protein BN871_EA_00060 [Paenibacillus sp. P22]